MHTCQKCQKPLTEFDVNFYFGVRKNENNLNSCQCYSCMTTGKIGSLIKRKHEKIPVKDILAHILCVIPLIIFLCITGASYSELFEKVFGQHIGIGGVILSAVIYTLFFGLSGPAFYIMPFVAITELPIGISAILFLALLFVFGIITWIWGAIYVIKRLGWEYDEGVVIGSHIEISTSYDGKTTIKEVNDWSDSGSWYKFTIAGMTFPFWSLFRIIYLCIIRKIIGIIKYNRNCPDEVKSGLDYAINNTATVYLSKSDIEKYQIELQKYNKKVEKIKSKYTISGETRLHEELNKISKPICYVTCTEIVQNQKTHRKAVLSSTDNELKHITYVENGKNINKIILGNRYIYSKYN